MDTPLIPVTGGEVTIMRNQAQTPQVASMQPPQPPPQPPPLPPRQRVQNAGRNVSQYVQNAGQYVQNAGQYVQTARQYLPAATPQPSTGTSGIRMSAIAFSAASGLFPIPLNPIFFPLQMTAFIILIIILLVKGYSFWTSALIAWIIPAVFAAATHYFVIGSVLSMFGRGESAMLT